MALDTYILKSMRLAQRDSMLVYTADEEIYPSMLVALTATGVSKCAVSEQSVFRFIAVAQEDTEASMDTAYAISSSVSVVTKAFNGSDFYLKLRESETVVVGDLLVSRGATHPGLVGKITNPAIAYGDGSVLAMAQEDVTTLEGETKYIKVFLF